MTTSTETKPGAESRSKAGILRRLDWRRDIIYVAVVVVFVLFGIMFADQGFLSSGNLVNILRQTAIITVMAIAMTFVIGAAEIDLSVGSVAGLTSVTTAMAIASLGLIPGILIGLATGAVVGATNGALVAFIKMPSFIVTLAMLGLAVGVAQWITDSAPQPILDMSYITAFGGGGLGPIPSIIVWSLVAVVLGWLLMNKTVFGRHVLATGANQTAAQYSGVKTAKIKFQVMFMSAMAAAIAGMLYAGRLQSGRFQWGTGDELTVIAAVILGGTALAGGRGFIVGSLFGSLLMGIINNGLILAGLDSSQQQVVRGIIIILAVALGRRR